MRILKSALCACAAWSLAAGGAVAQTATATKATPAVDGNDIVVIARKPVETKEALKYARDVSAPVDLQLARYNGFVCPMAIGFPAKVAAAITIRMRDVVEAAGTRLDKPECKGNMIVIAAKDGAEMLREMRRLKTHLIVGIDSSEIDKLIKSTDPVRAWTLSTVQNEYGDDPVQHGNDTPVLVTYTGSHLNPPTETTILTSVVVIDWSALVGKSSVQIADYVAMRTLARTRPVGGGGAVDTILALFDAKAKPPSELSEADLVYLKTLYHGTGARYARAQIGQIASGVKKAAREPQGEPQGR